MERLRVNHSRVTGVAVTTALFVAAFVGFHALSRALLGFNQSIAPLWPGTGLVLAALLLSPRERWWYWTVIALATSLANGAFTLSIPGIVPLQTTLIGVAQAVAQAWLISHWLK